MREWGKCRLSPEYFADKYCFIKETEQGVIPFKLFPYQKSALKDIVENRLVVVLKNRQVGWTWLVSLVAVWKAIFYQSANVIIISKNEDAAGEVLDYCKFIHSHLPPQLAPSTDRNRASLMAFPTLGSKIRALSSTSSSGIGFGSASLVILDENDFHPDAEANYIEIKPMIDAGGNRQLIILSAPDRTKLTSSFKEIWKNAKKGLNNFKTIFTPFGSVPWHTPKWLEEQKKEYPGREWETRYFGTETEALSVTAQGKFFDVDKLILMTERILPHIEKYDAIDTRGGIIKIFKPPVGSFRYGLFTDPSEGKEDPFHTVVVDLQTKEEVACAHGWFPSDEVARIHDTLVRHYNNASNSYYRTGYSGGRFKNALDNLYTPCQLLSRDLKGNEQAGVYGYWESGGLKKKLLGNLRDGIFAMEYIIHDAQTLDEFSMFMWLEGEDMPRVPPKEHDDRIIAWAGVADIITRYPSGNAEFITFHYDGRDGWQSIKKLKTG